MQATLVATLTELPTPELLARLSETSDWLEVRADLVGDLDPAALRRHYRGRLLYTLRSRVEGGECDDASPGRQHRLLAAARDFDLIDLEAERDLSPEVLGHVDPARRILSWHGGPTAAAALRERFEHMAEHHAGLFKLVPRADDVAGALAPLALLRSLRRGDVIAFAAGSRGAWTRLLAPRYGAPVVYGSIGVRAGAPGQPGLDALRLDYGLPELPPVERLFGVVGDPVAHSLSPRIHNGAYRALGIPALYLPFESDTFGDFWLDFVERGSTGVLGLPIEGLSVTAPFKESALAVSGASSPLAQRLQSANTLVLHEGVWEAETTDPAGVVNSLRQCEIPLRGRSVAVVGAGGAGRAAAAGMALEGARVMLVNRTVDSGLRVARSLGLAFTPLASFEPAAFEIVVNATALGRGAEDPPPFDPAAMAPGGAVLDMVYGDRQTALIERAAAAGLATVDGREVLLQQAARQFAMMTGHELPLEEARRSLAPQPAEAG